MTTAPTLWSFVAHADLIVKLVLATLVLASIYSWTIIWLRFRAVRLTKHNIQAFEQTFWSGINLSDYYQSVKNQQQAGLLHSFQAALQEYLSPATQALPMEQRLIGISRAMKSAQARDIETLSGQSSWLATIGSMAPYVGLFGTVWGIMSAFRSLGLVQQASVAMVAPGIAEALIATAIGLLVAIPAVVAYNRFSTQLESLETTYDNFHDELLNILQSQPTQEAKP